MPSDDANGANEEPPVRRSKRSRNVSTTPSEDEERIPSPAGERDGSGKLPEVGDKNSDTQGDGHIELNLHGAVNPQASTEPEDGGTEDDGQSLFAVSSRETSPRRGLPLLLSPSEDKRAPPGKSDSSPDKVTSVSPTTEYVRQLEEGIRELKARQEALEIKLSEFDSGRVREECLQPNSSAFVAEAGSQVRFLFYNVGLGFIALHRSRGAIAENHDAKTSFLLGETIEVFSTVSGVGKRKQILDNTKKKYNLASLSERGFVLVKGRPAMKAGREEEGGLKVPTMTSIIQYNPFTSLGQLSKAGWQKVLSPSEAVLGVASTDSLIVVTSTQNSLRLFSAGGGLELPPLRLAGAWPVAVAAARTALGDRVAILSLERSSTVASETAYVLEVLNVSVSSSPALAEVGRATLVLRGYEKIMWLGITEGGRCTVPVVVTSDGQVFGLFRSSTRPRTTSSLPRVAGGNETHAWHLLLHLREVIPVQFGSCPDLRELLWIVRATESHLSLFWRPRSWAEPPVQMEIPLLDCPYRVCAAYGTEISRPQYSEYSDLSRRNDKELKDPAIWKRFSADLLHEMAFLGELFQAELKSDLALVEGGSILGISGLASDPLAEGTSNARQGGRELLRQANRQTEIRMDKLRFKEFLKVLAEPRIELALELAHNFNHKKTLQAAIEQATTRGLKVLSEHLEDLLAIRFNLDPATTND